MKKLGIFAMSLAAAAVLFTACEKKPGPQPIEDVIPNGFYVLGEATGIADLNATGAAELQMANGINESTKQLREGMYEKYVVLEAGKPFQFAEKKGGLIVNWTAQLAKQELISDGQNPEGYFGQLAEGNAAMQVGETGLYHIVLDLNQDGLLDAAGGPQVILAPVNWGISGGMNGWSLTLGEKAGYTWTWANIEIPGNTEFKFKDEHGWKIFLDGETTQVSTETNLGAGLVPGADNIKVEEGGVYTITLTFELAGGDVKNSYKSTLTKTGDLVLDPATFVVGISGTMNGWADPAGIYQAWFDPYPSHIDASKVGTYVYKMEGVSFPAESEFKFRFNGNWLGVGAVEVSGVTPTGDDNFKGVEGAYDIVITVEWDGNQATSIKADFTEGVPVDPIEYVEGYLYVINEGTLTDINIYGWAPDKDNNNEIFGAWPGERISGDATSLTRVFFEKAIKGAGYKFIINGTGGQTADPEWTVTIEDENSHPYLKVNADNQLILVEEN